MIPFSPLAVDQHFHQDRSVLAKASVASSLGSSGWPRMMASHEKSQEDSGIRRQGMVSIVATLPPLPLPSPMFFCLVPKHQDRF